MPSAELRRGVRVKVVYKPLSFFGTVNKTHTWASKTGIKSFSLERAGPSNQRLGSKGRVQNTCKRWVCVSLRVWLYGEKLSMVEGSPTYLSYPG